MLTFIGTTLSRSSIAIATILGVVEVRDDIIASFLLISTVSILRGTPNKRKTA